ncbi:MAG: hypothetical protein GY799_10875 [Desulfobulbaceae bacterium]|nr:hypothetical protein [Desulfobulbaceae bacterium]
MSDLNFENLLDDRLFTTAELLGFLDREGADAAAIFDPAWFDEPASHIKEMFGESKRDALQKFVTDILGSSNSWLEGGAPTTGNTETWHSIPGPDGSSSGLYLVLQRSGEDLIIGLGGVYDTAAGDGDDAVAIKLSGNVPVAKVDKDGGWSMVLGQSSAPSCFALRLSSPSGNLLQDNPLLQLGGVSLKLSLGHSINVDFMLEQLQLPGESTPRSRTLGELKDSFNLSFVLNMFLESLTAEIGNPLRNLLGFGGDLGLPSIDWDRLAAGDASCLGDWFSELCSGNAPKINDWLGEFAKLLGLGNLSSLTVAGTGTRLDPWRVPLSGDDTEFLSKLNLTLAIETDGRRMAYPGIMVAFDPFDASSLQLHAVARTEIVGIDVLNGELTLLPTLSLDLKLTGAPDGSAYLKLLPHSPLTTLSIPSPAGGGGSPASLTVELDSVGAGLVFNNSLGLKAYFELRDVDINGRHWDVMDLNSMEEGLSTAVDTAKELLLDGLRGALGIDPNVPSVASHIGALLGLNAPISAPEWNVDLVVDGTYLSAFLNDPLQAVAWYHSRAIIASMVIDTEERTAYHYLMQDLYILLKGDGSSITGYGSKNDPWTVPLIDNLANRPTLNLEMVADVDPARPRLQLDFHARLDKIVDVPTNFGVIADVRASVLDVVLPDAATGQAVPSCVWLADVDLSLGLGDLPAISVGGISIDASTLTGSVGWARSGGLSYDLGLKDLTITYQPSADGTTKAPFEWGTLSLPSFGFAGDDSGWLPSGLNAPQFGPILLELYGQWLSSTTPQGFALAGLLGLLPNIGKFQLPDPAFPTWENSPWALPDNWPILDFDDWDVLLSNPWGAIKGHLAHLFSKPEWALPALRWLGAFFSDCLPDLSKPQLDWHWGGGKNDEHDSSKKRFPTLAELPFTITGHGTYEDPWRLQLAASASPKWHKGAFLVWLDPDGPPAMTLSSLAKIVAPHLAASTLTTADNILEELDLDGMVDLAGKLGSVNSEVARHCKGFDAEISAKLQALENWLHGSDGFYRRLPESIVEDEVNGRLRNVMALENLEVANHDEQLSHFASALSNFIATIPNIPNGNSLRLVLVGDEQTSENQWDDLLSSELNLADSAIQSHDFCQYGVAPDQQGLNLSTDKRATIVKLTALNTAPDQFGWLPMDRLQVHSPARQLQRVIDHLQAVSDEKIIVICHSTAGFAARVVVAEMADAASKIAGICAVGMPEVFPAPGRPFNIDPDLLPGVMSAESLQGLDFINGLFTAGETRVDSSLSRGIEHLANWHSSGSSFGYGDLISKEQLPERTVGLFENIPILADSFSGIKCQGFYTRLAHGAEETLADFSIKALLLSWLTTQLGTPPADYKVPSHVGFGLSWEDEFRFGENNAFFVHSQTRFDVFRFALGEQGEDGLQPLPRTRFAIDLHRSDGWLIGERDHIVRCRWMEFGLDLFADSCTPNVFFHDAGVNAGQLKRLGLESLEAQLWTAENQIRVLLEKLCDELPAPEVSSPLSCFMTGSGLFYEEGNKLVPHANSWQAVLTDPRSYFTSVIQTGFQDPGSDQAAALRCIFEELFGLQDAPFINKIITIMTSSASDTESRICLLVMQALGLFQQTLHGCFPVLLNWVSLLQNPKQYLQNEWAKFTDNSAEAQARRAILTAELAVEFQNLSTSGETTPKWLHNLAFDGNCITFTLGGDGFVLIEDGVQLCIPVSVDFIHGHLQVRFEVDVSGVIGCSSPLGSATLFGGASVFFEVLLTSTPVQVQASLSYGLDLGGGARFDLAASDQWKNALGRLLIQGLGSRFMAEIEKQIENTHLKSFIRCLAGGSKDDPVAQGLALPGGLADVAAYFEASHARCLLNSLGDMLEVRNHVDGVAQNGWGIGEFCFAYPVGSNPKNLELKLATAHDGLQLYSSSPDEVVLHANLGLLFPENGAVAIQGLLKVETTFSGNDIGLLCAYSLPNGALCRLTAGGLDVSLYPFAGFADLLGDMEAILDQCLPALFGHLQGADSGSARYKVCALAKLFSVELPDLRRDPVAWLIARLKVTEVITELNDLFSDRGLVISNSGVLSYTHSVSLNLPAETAARQDILAISLGGDIGTVGSRLGLGLTLTPLPLENIALSLDLACWLDAVDNFQFMSEFDIGLAPQVLVIGGQSIEPACTFSFDTSRPANDVTLKMAIPDPAGGDDFVSLAILPTFSFDLNGSIKQLIQPILNGILSNDSVEEWLDEPTYSIGQILVDLKLLGKVDESYVLSIDIQNDWHSSEQVLKRILSTLLNMAADLRLVEFGDNEGGIFLYRDGDWYGLRIVHPGIRVFDDPEIDLVLGRDTDWIKGNGCGLSGGSTDVKQTGLAFFMLKKSGDDFNLGCRFLLSDVGLFIRGKGEASLFDLKGLTLKGLGLRGYVDMELDPIPSTGSSTKSTKWAMRCELHDMGLPISSAAGTDNPTANSLVAASGDNSEPINPAFDISFAYGNKFAAFIGDNDAKDGVAWLDISKQFGPVYIQSLGLHLVDKNLSILIDGKVEMMGLTVAVDDLSLTLLLDDPFNTDRWQIDCAGLGVSYVSPGLVVSGALLKQDSSGRIEYSGLCTIETAGTTFSAIGAYTQIGNDPSLFVFVVVNTTIGGPPMFFIRGLAGGFGYNRDFLTPPIDKVENFPLVALATGSSTTNPLELLKDKSFPPTRGAYWFAAGVKFTTFELFKSFGLLYVMLNRGLEIGLLGRTELEYPEDKPLVHVAMNFKALFSSTKGIMMAQAQLTNDSWLFDPNCKLQGGFAVASWFAGEHKGDFVITLGGYHADYTKPAHYPDVPRLGFNWRVSSSTTIKGSSYFALTSNAVMAGGELDASYKSGALKAWFKVWANLLIQWKPFFYSFDIGVSIGASYRMSVKIPFIGRISKTFKVELGGELQIWGPDFAGKATLNWCIISFTVRFGSSNGRPNLPALTWDEFSREFLPSDKGVKQYLKIHAEKGLLEEQGHNWLMKAECVLRTETVFPTQTTQLGGLSSISHGKKIDLKPMHLASVQSSHFFDIKAGDGTSIFTSGSWQLQDGENHIYEKLVGGNKTVSRIQLSFDTQEVPKALWQFDVSGDPLTPGEPLTGDMGMSVRLYIDNDEVFKEMAVIPLDLNDLDPDCVMPLPFNVHLHAILPPDLHEKWGTLLDLTSTETRAVLAAIYSNEWQSRRQAAVAEMRRQGASLMNEANLVGSRIHHLANRKAMPQVSTLYNGVSDAEPATKTRPFQTAEEHPAHLGWNLSVITLPARYLVADSAVITSIDKVDGAKDLPRISLDRFRNQPKTGDGRILKVGQSRYSAKSQPVRGGRVLLPRGRAGGRSQLALQKQLYNGLSSTAKGAVLQAGMVHIWQTTRDVGGSTSINVKGTQATRICCFDSGGGLLYDRETVGIVKVTLPEDTRTVTVTGLGRRAFDDNRNGAGAVSLKSASHGQALCGWSSADVLPQVNSTTVLCRGVVLQSSDNPDLQAEPGLVNVAEFLRKRSRCVTHLPATVLTVGVLVARSKGPAELDGDIDIGFSDKFIVTKGKVVPYGEKLLCLYGVKQKDDKAGIERLSVVVRGRNGWMLAGIFGGLRSLKFWESQMDLSVPPSPSQNVCLGASSEVNISQSGLAERLAAHQKNIKNQAEKRAESANIWKRERV